MAISAVWRAVDENYTALYGTIGLDVSKARAASGGNYTSMDATL